MAGAYGTGGGGAALLTHTKWAWRRRAKCVTCEIGPIFAEIRGQRCWIGFPLWFATGGKPARNQIFRLESYKYRLWIRSSREVKGKQSIEWQLRT